jgi:Xaa-Pro aminopeptidase/Xaa-Pro dipeptidase
MLPDPSPQDTRVGRLRLGLPGGEALLVLDGRNLRYLTGFSGGEGALLAGSDWLLLLVDGRYVTQARSETVGVEVQEYRSRLDGICDAVLERGVAAVGFESPALTAEEYFRLQEKLPVPLKARADRFQMLRAVKEPQEAAQIRRAGCLAAEALAAVRGMIRPGVREREVALELEYRMRRNGAEAASFDTIVAAGANAALPHATPGSRTIHAGDCLIVDYGAVSGGYHSDETCTFFVGFVDARQREVYGIVREAHDRAIQAIRPGVACGEIDRIARGCLAEAGLDSYFSHGTGHGVGLDVHEAPRLASGREEVLEAGMVVTVEPGVYLPDRGGVRIEDTVLVTQEGYDVLTPTSKELTIL